MNDASSFSDSSVFVGIDVSKKKLDVCLLAGHQQLWMLKAHLDAIAKEARLEQIKQVG